MLLRKIKLSPTKVEDFIGLSVEEQYRQIESFTVALYNDLGMYRMPRVALDNHPVGCRLCPVDLTIYISPNQINYHSANPLVVLAHEVRHFYQVINGMLRFGTHPFIPSAIIAMVWKEEFFSLERLEKMRHHQFPWEADAIEYERCIAERLNMDPFPRLEMDMEERFIKAKESVGF